jgi:hypothetical protein
VRDFIGFAASKKKKTAAEDGEKDFIHKVIPREVPETG